MTHICDHKKDISFVINSNVYSEINGASASLVASLFLLFPVYYCLKLLIH